MLPVLSCNSSMCRPTLILNKIAAPSGEEMATPPFVKNSSKECWSRSGFYQNRHVAQTESSTTCVSPRSSPSCCEPVRRRVSFPEKLVTDIMYISFTPREDCKDLFYQTEDYKRFKTELRNVKIEFVKRTRGAQNMMLQADQMKAEQKCVYDVKSLDYISDRRETSCLQRVVLNLTFKFSSGVAWAIIIYMNGKNCNQQLSNAIFDAIAECTGLKSVCTMKMCFMMCDQEKSHLYYERPMSCLVEYGRNCFCPTWRVVWRRCWSHCEVWKCYPLWRIPKRIPIGVCLFVNFNCYICL
jgi:hypothetical protein